MQVFESGKISPDFAFVIECVCAWGKQETFLDFVVIALEQVVGAKKQKIDPKKKKEANKKATLALYLFSDALSQEACKQAILSQERTVKKITDMLSGPALDQLCDLLANFQDDEPFEDFLISAFDCYPKILLHQIAQKIVAQKSAKANSSDLPEVFS